MYKRQEKDYAKAAEYFQPAADSGNQYAQYSLAGLYLHGKGVEKNPQTAYVYYNASAEKGNAYAVYELAKMERDGIGTNINKQLSDEQDVYKRQIIYSMNHNKAFQAPASLSPGAELIPPKQSSSEKAEPISPILLKQELCGISDTLTDAVNAVSYTHLDVYKRQRS